MVQSEQIILARNAIKTSLQEIIIEMRRSKDSASLIQLMNLCQDDWQREAANLRRLREIKLLLGLSPEALAFVEDGFIDVTTMVRSMAGDQVQLTAERLIASYFATNDEGIRASLIDLVTKALITGRDELKS
jgi:hypothetical protein